MIDFKADLAKLISPEEFQRRVDEAKPFVARAQQDDFGGWVDLPINYDKDEFARIKKAAAKIPSGVVIVETELWLASIY